MNKEDAKGIAGLIGLVSLIGVWVVCAIAPTVGVIWIACHFISKWW